MFRRFNTSSCPISRDLAALANYNRKYQQSCPANAVYLIEGILNIIRVVLDDVILLLSTVLSMSVKLLTLFFVSNRESMRFYIEQDWAYLKKLGKPILSHISDLFLDMLLNSGKIGTSLLSFLHNICGKINSGINWFLNVWCNYYDNYMIEFLSGMRRFIGTVGAGFEMLNDFMDEVFQGILPAAFVAKYGQSGFQALLQEKYSEPTKHEDKVSGNKHVSSNANVRPESKSDKTRGINKKVLGLGLAASGAVASRFATGFEIFSGIKGLIDDIELSKLYPPNFTLFDLSSIVNTVDDMMKYIQKEKQISCYAYQAFEDANMTYTYLPCPVLNMDTYSNTTVGTTSIDATLCWYIIYYYLIYLLILRYIL